MADEASDALHFTPEGGLDHLAIVREVAARIGVLLPDGTLGPIDSSLTLVEFVVMLEDATGKALPSSATTLEHFSSLESIVELLERAA